MPIFYYASCAPLNMLAVHRHGRGTRLDTCPVYAACNVAFVACVNCDEISVMYLILLHQLCIGMDEACCDVCPFWSTYQQMAVSWASQLGCNG